MARKLYRSREDRVIAGVGGGLGEYFDVDPIIFRIAFVLLAIFGGSGLLLYIIGWLIIPEAPRGQRTVAADAPRKAVDDETDDSPIARTEPRVVAGGIFLVLGTLFLFQNIFGIQFWSYFWPLVLIAIGLSIILRSKSEVNNVEKPDKEGA